MQQSKIACKAPISRETARNAWPLAKKLPGQVNPGHDPLPLKQREENWKQIQNFKQQLRSAKATTETKPSINGKMPM